MRCCRWQVQDPRRWCTKTLARCGYHSFDCSRAITRYVRYSGLNGKTFATFGAACVDDGATTTGFHTYQKAMGAFAACFGWLVGSFHVKSPLWVVLFDRLPNDLASYCVPLRKASIVERFPPKHPRRCLCFPVVFSVYLYCVVLSIDQFTHQDEMCTTRQEDKWNMPTNAVPHAFIA